MPQPLIDDIRRLTTEIRALAPRIEQDREVPAYLIDRLAALGVFRLAAPRAAGGAEAEPADLVEVCEELGRADGSVGWCAMIGAATGIALGYLPEDTAAELLADPRFLIAGVAAPMGRAVPVDGGHRITGRWPFASACRQATWLVGGVLVADGTQPPRPRLAIMAPGDLTIHDTWDVAGLRGTGSHDIEAADVFVPDARVFSLAAPPVQPGPLYEFPPLGLLALGIGAVSLGIARAAIADFAELAHGKRNPVTGETIAAKPSVRAAVAEAESLRASGLAYLRAEVAATGADPERRARLRLAVRTATRNAVRAVDLVYQAAGGSAVYAASPLQRHFRDVHVAAQHAMVNTDVLETAGAVLLGESVNTARL
ncbi:acyl-CoA dehydrogenase family protein [Amorphoplanes digitatis]|uniref:Alkylation response protein AidB-like acyl-CoA dehydrogenase n=1 Tax=Actinoplanes digitatis TaxID=1868 RepID=A0A7W7MV80_9ACTN|nr:acyl-CoA dehydrogenase family protein [Actinoplanes digitatis]MBB4767404.1 alkylation response protein AidB-like acyl-CoA dehydrogenase [Actinoplanes digitatis]GID98348.1 hydroxylase [Actinoplanes digitatis]